MVTHDRDPDEVQRRMTLAVKSLMKQAIHINSHRKAEHQTRKDSQHSEDETPALQPTSTASLADRLGQQRPNISTKLNSRRIWSMNDFFDIAKIYELTPPQLVELMDKLAHQKHSDPKKEFEARQELDTLEAQKLEAAEKSTAQERQEDFDGTDKTQEEQ